MTGLKGLRDRIKSIKSTEKITKAMKMVTAAKLRRATERAENCRHYTKAVEDILVNISKAADISHSSNKLLSAQKDEQHLVVVISSDRGLCGNFNSIVAKKAISHIDGLKAYKKDVKLIFIGSKAHELLKHRYKNEILDVISFKDKKQIEHSDIVEIRDKILSLLDKGELDICNIIFNEFVSVMTQIPCNKQLIPVESKPSTTEIEEDGFVAEFEPNKRSILDKLLPENLTVQLNDALLQSVAGEYASRMRAMDNATRNAGEMIEKLSLQYNRTRQANITKELIEIISGAEAI